ncbi:MAG: hypothetical protein AB2L07_11390 [Thermoanaerobaculaceae bacterium]
MSVVYVLLHSHEIQEDKEDIKLIGVYSSAERGRESITRLSSQPGFRESPEGFHLEPYEVDVDNWTEGFATVR